MEQPSRRAVRISSSTRLSAPTGDSTDPRDRARSSYAQYETGTTPVRSIRESVYRRSLPLATRTLRIEPSSLGEAAGLAGAVHLVLDELFSPQRLAQWLPHSTPAGHPELASDLPASSAA